MRNTQILVFDDSATIVKELNLLLTHAIPHATIHTSMDYDSAINVMNIYDIELIITDLQTPGLSGIDFLNSIPEKYNNRNLKKIVYTATGENTLIQASLSPYVDAFLHKGTDNSVILTAVKKVLSGRVYIDLQYLKSRYGDRFKELLEIFLEDNEGVIDQLKTADATNDTDKLELIAHKLKGSASVLGNEMLSKLCAVIDMRAQKHQLAREALERLEIVFSDLHTYLDTNEHPPK